MGLANTHTHKTKRQSNGNLLARLQLVEVTLVGGRLAIGAVVAQPGDADAANQQHERRTDDDDQRGGVRTLADCADGNGFVCM